MFFINKFRNGNSVTLFILTLFFKLFIQLHSMLTVQHLFFQSFQNMSYIYQPYQRCMQCGISFKYEHEHNDDHFNWFNQTNENTSTNSCQRCGKLFCSDSCYKKHIERIHDNYSNIHYEYTVGETIGFRVIPL
jgi:hypothetical protein